MTDDSRSRRRASLPTSGEEDRALEYLWVRAVHAADERHRLLLKRLEQSEIDAREASSPIAFAQALPQILRLAEPKEISKAIRPIVEAAIADTARRHASAMAELIFPLILPAVRRAIVEYFRDMMQRLEKTLENSLSFEGLLWRIEALRTGRSFAEVALIKSLIYRVEEAYLIHKTSGLLLAHAARTRTRQGDDVAAMLTAIRDFVTDAFSPESSSSLRGMQVGNVSIWVEDMPHSVIAVVVRGEVPQEYRQTLMETSQKLSRTYELQLARFNGDTEPFIPAIDELEDLLLESVRDDPEPSDWDQLKRRCIRVLGLALSLAALVSIFWFGWSHYEEAKYKSDAFRAFIAQLEARPGVTIIEQSPADFRLWVWRDRLAQTSDLKAPPFAQLTWSEFISLDPVIVKRRAQRILAPPATLAMDFQDGTLSLRGTATRSWISRAENQALAIAGVDGVDVSQVQDLDQKDFDNARRALENLHVPLDASGLPPPAAPVAWTADFVRETVRLDQHASALGLGFYIIVRVGTKPIQAAAARRRLQAFSNYLGWELQKAGLTTYRLVRFQLESQPSPLSLKVAQHGEQFK